MLRYNSITGRIKFRNDFEKAAFSSVKVKTSPAPVNCCISPLSGHCGPWSLPCKIKLRARDRNAKGPSNIGI